MGSRPGRPRPCRWWPCTPSPSARAAVGVERGGHGAGVVAVTVGLATGRAALRDRVKVLASPIVTSSMASEKVAVTSVEVATCVAPSAGVTPATAGGVVSEPRL